MYDCTIIISHFESLPFLEACVNQIRKYKHPEIEQHIIISEQSGKEDYDKVVSQFGNDPDITIAKMKSLYSGYGIDYIMRFVDIKTKYICQLHADAFPIHKNWLYLSIKLIEEDNFAFVGQLHFETNSTQGNYYYIKNNFFSMSPTFNVSTTAIYKEMALEGGFTRFHARTNVDVPMSWANNDWSEWVKVDYNARGSDDDVVAFCWEDNHREHKKLGLAITHIMGQPGESGFGRIIDDVVFHFGFARESIGVMEHMGENYRNWTAKIKAGYNDQLIEEMLIFAKQHPNGSGQFESRLVWEGTIKASSPPSESLNKKLSELKLAK